MSTIKNGQILLYCYFNKIIKETLQYSAKNMWEMFVIQHTGIWPNFILLGLRVPNFCLIGLKLKCNLHYAPILVMTPQILKSAGFTKTKISISRERNITFSSNKKILSHVLLSLWFSNVFRGNQKATLEIDGLNHVRI